MTEEHSEIIMFQTETSLELEVVFVDETVRLSQAQMAKMFQTSRNNITMHVRNIFKEGELEEKVVGKDFLHTTQHGAIPGKTQESFIKLYNLDVIISVGYRVKSQVGTRFRQWAINVIKEYAMKWYAIHNRIERLEKHAVETDQKLELFIKKALPIKEWIFYDGQVFDAYIFVSNLIKSAKKKLILIDNYLDETVLKILSKRSKWVNATLYTEKVSSTFQLDLDKHNAQYPEIEIKITKNTHDRFLIIDNEVYHIWASIKDLGKKLFAFSKMELSAKELVERIEGR